MKAPDRPDERVSQGAPLGVGPVFGGEMVAKRDAVEELQHRDDLAVELEDVEDGRAGAQEVSLELGEGLKKLRVGLKPLDDLDGDLPARRLRNGFVDVAFGAAAQAPSQFVF